MNRILRGAIAGAAGTVALDLVTYGDMLLRGRAASDVPAEVAGVLADHLGIEALAASTEGEAADNRRQAAGALLGYKTGVGMGVLYGLLDAAPGSTPAPLAGVTLGLGAMAASDLPIALTGVSDPATWTAADWLSDLIPHLVYGLVVVAVYDAIGGDGE
ncbi:MAG: hypothetical protein QM692_17945 [Thermomicrobiales bacterium]